MKNDIREKLISEFPEILSFLRKLNDQSYEIEYSNRADCFNLFYRFRGKQWDEIYVDLEISRQECILFVEKKKDEKFEIDEVLSFEEPCEALAEALNKKIEEYKGD